MIIKEPVRFVFMHQTVAEVTIIFGEKNQVFQSCAHGVDLADFDALLEYFIPDIDLEKINYHVARWWEKKCYQTLSTCKQQRTLKKAFIYFCECIERKYAKHLRLSTDKT